LKTTYMFAIKDLASSSRARKIVAVKGFFKTMHDFELINTNPAEKLEAPSIERNIDKEHWTKEEVLTLVNTAKNKRDKAITMFLLYTGLRISEALEVTLEQYQQDKFVCVCKGGVKREIYVSKECRTIVDEYINTNRKEGCGHLFVSNMGNQMSRQNVDTMLKKLAKKAGFDKPISPHEMRHAFASEIGFKYGVEVLREVIGHSSIQTSQLYMHMDKNKIKDVMVQF
ncbi:MAG: tyrosine-type recombinase/integrase, partial [Bacteroidales bacterium]